MFYIREVEKQNKTYFELKARELLERQKTDLVSQAAANLLFKALSVTRDEILQKYKDYKLPQQSTGYVANQFPRLPKQRSASAIHQGETNIHKMFATSHLPDLTN